MKVMIQYLLADGTWSDWMPFVVQDEQLPDGVRFARVLKDENPEKPNVAWMIFYEDKKNRNQFNKVELFIDKALKSLAIEK